MTQLLRTVKCIGLLFVIVLLVTNCDVKNSTSAEQQVQRESEQSQVVQLQDKQEDPLVQSEVKNEKKSDCIFDQETQTDDFLESIPELSNYKWDQERHQALRISENGDTIIIVRGGCNHFTLGIWKIQHFEHEPIGDPDNLSGKYKWIEEALSLGKLLQTELSIEKVENAIETKSFKIDQVEKGITELSFEDTYLSDNNYLIEKEETEGRRKIGICMYLN